jgi:diguanylate cyclase (GGDEF)-like protein
MSKSLPEQFFEQFFDKLSRIFISDELLNDPMSDALPRALILVGVVTISAVSGLFWMIALGFAYGASGAPLLLLATLIALTTVLGYIGTLWLFKKQQTLFPAANLYALTTTFSTVTPCMITGGISSSPYILLVLVVPIFMFLIAGRESGTYWSLVVVISVAILMLLETVGVEFPQIISQEWIARYRLLTWLTTLALLVLSLRSYERNFESLNERITEERGQFAYEALHDPLTGLSNRKLFFSRAQEAVDFAMAREFKAALIYVDLDNFKLINDGFGHEAGDEVLNAVAQRLQASVRSMDTVARLGGDEFAIVLHGIEHAEVAQFMVEKLQSVLREPLQVGQNILSTTGSIGVALAPDQGLDVDSLLRQADEEMYRAKEVRVAAN